MSTRVRNRVTSQDQEWSYDQTILQSGLDTEPVDSSFSGTYTDEELREDMTDVVTPKFKRVSARGGIVNNPMSQTKTIIRDSLCGCTYEYSWEQFIQTNDPDPGDGEWCPYEHTYVGTRPSTDFLSLTNLPTLPSYSSSTLIDQVVSKAWARIDVTDVQSLVMLAESKKTVASLASIFLRLIKIIKKIKRLDAKALANELSAKELSDRYMELRYALRPLMYDVKGASAALNTEASDVAKRITFRDMGTYHDDDSSTVTYPQSATNLYGTWEYDIVRTTKWERDVVVRAGVLTELETLNALNIWGMTQPVESLWELVPFSFIIDWFINVGSVISAWTPNYGLQALASWYTVETREYQYLAEKHINCKATNGTNQNYKVIAYNRDKSNLWYDKTVISKVRIPEPRRPILPSFSIRLNTWKLTDLTIIAKKLWR